MSKEILMEVCVDSVASAVAAERGGAHRIELCSNLIEGGITPSVGLLQAVLTSVSIPVHPIIRPRAGDFCYTADEIDVMLRDIQVAKSAGAHGVVFGVLGPDGAIDIDRCTALTNASRPLSVTFHRAFDLTADLDRALESVCNTGADRILTSGGEQECTQGVHTIARLVAAAKDRITIMAGGGINPKNATEIIHRTGVTEIHVGLATPVRSSMRDANPRVNLRKTHVWVEDRTEVLEESVRSMAHAISAGTNGRK